MAEPLTAEAPAAQSSTPATPSRPSAPTVYDGWPFDTAEARRRQEETAEALRLPRQTTLDLGEGVSMKLVLVPAGRFVIGSPADEEDRDDGEGPQREATISKPFYMGVHEVTQGQWRAVMGTTVAQQRDKANPVWPLVGQGDVHPMYCVSWQEATEFCIGASGRTGRMVRLPTEAEWEHACRAGTTTPFHAGWTISADQANYNGNHVYSGGAKGRYRQMTVAAGSFQPNAFGLYDMHGNVREWCSDWYAESHGNAAVVDPTGPAEGTLRVVRGGSWNDHPSYCRSASRGGNLPGLRDPGNGFRVAVGGLD